MDLLFSVEKTAKNFIKAPRVSWSQYSEYQTCMGWWFSRNYLVFDASVPVVLRLENTRAAPGSIIQKLFEVFVNSRVYHRCPSVEKAHEWFDYNHDHLWELATFPVEFQYDPIFDAPRAYRNYFKEMKQGQAQILDAWKKGMDPGITGVQPIFLDFDAFSKVYGSEDAFHKKMKRTYRNVLTLLMENNFDFDSTLSEIWVETKFGNSFLTGFIDFVYNKWGHGVFNHIGKLEDKYLVLDGKWSVGNWAKKEQLFYYSVILYLTTGKMPEQVGFIDWSKAKFHWEPFNLWFVEKLKEDFKKMEAKFEEIRNEFRRGNDFFEFFSFRPIEFKPSQDNCTFCSVLGLCPHAKDKKVVPVEFLWGHNVRKDILKAISKQDAPEKKGIREITL